jgi:hypothetical protein
VILFPICPLDHTTPEPVELRVTVAPLHKKVDPLAVMTGGEGKEAALTAMALEAPDIPQLFDTVAV